MHIQYMGVVGRFIGEHLGRGIGRLAGKHLGRHTGIGEEQGGDIGKTIGSNILGQLIPFKKGGKVKKTGAALVHKGEFILPKGVRPSTHQIALVRKRHKRRK